MTEEPHRPAPSEAETPSMPRWVPTVIGLVLVAMASLAVYTGIRYRNPTLANGIVKSRRPARPMTDGAGPPGEPEPGSSLVFPGDAADNTPAAREAVTGRARAEVTGTGHSINSMVRIWARRGLITKVVPEDAMISVNDLAIGQASQFDTMDEVYDFPAPGSYTIRISAPGYKDQQFIVTVAENAKDEIARLDVKLVR
jgi:hypothetical protein